MVKYQAVTDSYYCDGIGSIFDACNVYGYVTGGVL
jgi:hypothetical protein